MKGLNELDILKVAIAIEEEGAQFYGEMYEKEDNNTEKKHIFYSLMQEEKNHAAIFQNLYKEAVLKREKEANHTLFQEHVPELVQTFVDYFAFSEKNTFSEKSQSFKDIINEAVDQEYRSLEFYFKLMQCAKTQEIKDMLHTIIREEEQHVVKLKEMIYFKKTNISIEEHIHFVENMLDSMKDWVRVIDLEDNIIYANRPMKEALGYYVIGRKCFEVIGRSEPCDNCVSRQCVDEYGAVHKEEQINDGVYSVMSSPLRALNGEVDAVIEVLRDVTEAKAMEAEIKARNDKLNHDLQIARKMQYSLLPKTFNNDKAALAYAYIPSEMIGGDFFDAFYIDPSHIGIYIADVSGHGVPASMLTMFLRQSINKDELSPAQVLKKLYRKYSDTHFGEEIYITMFYAVIDVENHRITYANAGHHTIPMVFNQDNEEVTYLNASGIPISNWVQETEYENNVRALKAGDRLLFLTDGVTEVSNVSGEQYGDERLKDLVLKNKEKPIKDLKDLLLRDLRVFQEGSESKQDAFADDVTALFLEIK